MSQPSASDTSNARDLAVTQRAAREVPQRTLAALRLVDREHLVVAVGEVHEERRVRRPRHAPEQIDVAVAQELARPLVGDGHQTARQFQRGQMCPSGFIGKSHSGQGGRPPSTAATPLRIIVRIWARVA